QIPLADGLEAKVDGLVRAIVGQGHTGRTAIAILGRIPTLQWIGGSEARRGHDAHRVGAGAQPGELIVAILAGGGIGNGGRRLIDRRPVNVRAYQMHHDAVEAGLGTVLNAIDILVVPHEVPDCTATTLTRGWDEE